MKLKNLKNPQRGFALIEVMIAVAIFALFAVGIYSGIQFVFKVIYNSRLKIVEEGILNEQVEIIRNIPYEKIGIVNGSPAGVLDRNVTITRNGINFLITRTIRNVDDPFDGTIGGTPNDFSPADYKVADIAVTCSTCSQRTPFRFSTYIAPKNLEGNPNHGALFIKVFDANGTPVAGANVHIVSTSTDPVLNMTDTTDNEGMLKLVDIATGTAAYSIVVSKNGYTTDQTNSPSVENPNPIKEPATVAAKDVTTISFSIDFVSSLAISTINNSCQAVGSVPLNILGTKLIGTEPEVFKTNLNATTNGSGIYNFNNLEWDAYSLKSSGYDLIGSIPALPIILTPGTNQPVKLVLGANTANSLLVNVVDSITNQPLANAQVTLNENGALSKPTGVGYINQTDWSGGSGQLIMSNPAKYWTDDGKVSIDGGNLKLKKVGTRYSTPGSLESSVFDFGDTANLVNLIWTPLNQISQVGSRSVRLQIATSNTSTPASWNYAGYDGTSGTFFDENNFSLANIPAGRYVRYKIFLSTANNRYTPTVSDLLITYISTCTPPGQAYFGGLASQEYQVDVVKAGYQDSSQVITVAGEMILGVKMVEN